MTPWQANVPWLGDARLGPVAIRYLYELQQTVYALRDDLTAAQAANVALQDDLTALTARVTANEADIADHEARIVTLEP